MAEGVSKVYEDGVVALKDVTVEFKPGRINCLLGENGAGKSTLAKIVAGVLEPTRGVIKINGREVHFKSPRDALRMGIGIVYQYPSLFEDLTVVENVMVFSHILGKLKGIAKWSSLEKEARRFEEFVRAMGFRIDVYRKVYSLPANIKQIVEILRLLYAQMNTLILDEATSMLTPLETEKIYETVCRLRDEGRNVIWITHKPQEVRQICDRVVVLRRGRIVYTAEGAPSTAEEMDKIISYMFGAEEAEKFKQSILMSTRQVAEARGLQQAPEVLVIKNLRVRGDYGDLKVKDLNLVIWKGEIVGLAGIAGHGQRELVEAIVGLRKVETGEMHLAGVDVTKSPAQERSKAGLVYIPAERLKKAVAIELSILLNLAAHWLNVPSNTIKFTKKVAGMPLVDYEGLKAHAVEVLGKFNVSYPGITAPIKSLSGGNIQKLVLAKVLERDNVILVVAEEPTAGLDFKTTSEVRLLLRELSKRGISILLVSSDIYELLELSDRLLVMYDGRIVKEYRDTASIDMLELSKYMLGLGARSGS